MTVGDYVMFDDPDGVRKAGWVISFGRFTVCLLVDNQVSFVQISDIIEEKKQ